jgi:hypothetical protein
MKKGIAIRATAGKYGLKNGQRRTATEDRQGTRRRVGQRRVPVLELSALKDVLPGKEQSRVDCANQEKRQRDRIG